MQILRTAIPDILLLTPEKFVDARGYLSETYNKRALREVGVACDFVQDNHSFSASPGTLRGLHFQAPPFSQAKLIRVIRGAILDICVDLRLSAPTFGQHVALKLSAADRRQAFAPIGFAHGFITLAPDTEVIYKVSNYYAPTHDFGLAWNDPALAIDWGEMGSAPILSERDQSHPLLRDLIAQKRVFE